MTERIFILGAGMTGLSAGFASGLPVFEAARIPGGICSSYYMVPGSNERLEIPPKFENAYRFEYGGGHWIFGGDSLVTHFLQRFVPITRYGRRSSVYFQKPNRYVPYPIQNHLSYLDKQTATNALLEMQNGQFHSMHTMKDWLHKNFGSTLCDLFFYPFHELYTADLYERIAPQDPYKSPLNMQSVIQGAMGKTPPAVGYNTTFLYPVDGLNALVRKIAGYCDIRYGKTLVQIDLEGKRMFFDDGSQTDYDSLVSTLPLNKLVRIAGLELDDPDDPYTSVLVLNVGAKRGDRCPNDHWLYNPDTASGFHRVGFYSNVDTSFLPRDNASKNDAVSIYVEKAYPGGKKPSDTTIGKYTDQVIQELQQWGFIQDVDVADPTWIDVAYTWSWPNSSWRETALAELEKHRIYSVGRYGSWVFYGISQSIKDGLLLGSSLKSA